MHSVCFLGFFPFFSLITSPVGLSYSNLIIDSGPIVPNPKMVQNYFNNHFNIPSVCHPLMTPLVNLIWCPNKIKSYGLPIDNLNQIIGQHNSNKLFVNSLKDPYIVQKDIKECIKVCRKNNQSTVNELWFDQTKHCQHYKEKTDEYITDIKKLTQMK